MMLRMSYGTHPWIYVERLQDVLGDGWHEGGPKWDEE
jgi:hypothetical protein